ncbi:Phage integrase family protein [Burkholderia sp. OK233]|nr:Phage integrase family protein [Burkholderia sp. OK233]
MKTQLFAVHSVDLPYSALSLTNGTRIFTQHVEDLPFIYWPDGRPCDAVNLYFIDIAHETTGASLKCYASQLSHIIRFCGGRHISFDAFNDSHMLDFSKELQSEQTTRWDGGPRRNNNTVRAIIRRTIHFFMWYQRRLRPFWLGTLIGEWRSSPQIIVKKQRKSSWQDRKEQSYYTHRAMPPDSIRNPKHPISQSVVEDLERCIDKLSLVESQKPSHICRYQRWPGLLAAQLEYLRSRRHFMLWLMKRTGLRSSEMTDISVKDHSDILHQKRIQIPTRKRRQAVAPLRNFPISLVDATIFARYLAARHKFVAATMERKPHLNAGKSLFLGSSCQAIGKGALERDFNRIIAAAGHKRTEACFSMFRHRFITYEVIAQLRSSGKARNLITVTEYMAMLKRVIGKTGHGSPQSIWHYVDFAWDEMNLWGNVDKAVARLNAADRLFEDLLALQHDLAKDAQSTPTEFVESIAKRLIEITGNGRTELGVEDE